jgi:hypothetical protein
MPVLCGMSRAPGHMQILSWALFAIMGVRVIGNHGVV